MLSSKEAHLSLASHIVNKPPNHKIFRRRMQDRKEFFLSLAIIFVTVLLMIGAYLRWLPLNFAVGPYRFVHWLGWIGTFFIAISTPMFYILRRRYPKRNVVMTRIHTFGNLFAFMLISIHFAQQASRSVHPEDHTGLTIFIIVSILVASGFLNRFQILERGTLYPPHRNRFLHVSLTSAFYIVVIIHILHSLGFLVFI
jgi:uncharacterized membrane protein YidH (DUF202 family)